MPRLGRSLGGEGRVSMRLREDMGTSKEREGRVRRTAFRSDRGRERGGEDRRNTEETPTSSKNPPLLTTRNARTPTPIPRIRLQEPTPRNAQNELATRMTMMQVAMMRLRDGDAPPLSPLLLLVFSCSSPPSSSPCVVFIILRRSSSIAGIVGIVRIVGIRRPKLASRERRGSVRSRRRGVVVAMRRRRRSERVLERHRGGREGRSGGREGGQRRGRGRERFEAVEGERHRRGVRRHYAYSRGSIRQHTVPSRLSPRNRNHLSPPRNRNHLFSPRNRSRERDTKRERRTQSQRSLDVLHPTRKGRTRRRRRETRGGRALCVRGGREPKALFVLSSHLPSASGRTNWSPDEARVRNASQNQQKKGRKE